jgi:hypothetical protein
MPKFDIYKYLGRILSFIDPTTRIVSNSPKRNPEFVLYQMEVSPFCKRVMNFLRREKLGMEIRDILESETDFMDLMTGGKIDQVPCLRIRKNLNSKPSEDQWIYESKEIIEFLKKI